MKKRLCLLSAVSLVMLLGGPSVWAASGTCPPEKKAVETFCNQQSPDKAQQCVKEINANCKVDQLAAEKTRAAERSRAEVMPVSEKSQDDGAYVYHLCVQHFNGGYFGCWYWLR